MQNGSAKFAKKGTWGWQPTFVADSREVKTTSSGSLIIIIIIAADPVQKHHSKTLTNHKLSIGLVKTNWRYKEQVSSVRWSRANKYSTMMAISNTNLSAASNSGRCTELAPLFLSFISHQQPTAYLTRGYSPPNSWPIWTILSALHSGRLFKGNKRFFTRGTSQKKQVKNCWALEVKKVKWKIAGQPDSHKLSLIQGFSSAWIQK